MLSISPYAASEQIDGGKHDGKQGKRREMMGQASIVLWFALLGAGRLGYAVFRMWRRT